MSVSTSTWPRDSHGLFDYETTSAVRSNFLVKEEGKIIRLGNECSFELQIKPGSVPLANIFADKGTTYSGKIYLKAMEDPSELLSRRGMDAATDWSSVWVSIRSLKEHSGFKLSNGDYIKVGRKQFRVKQMSVDPQATATYDLHDKKNHIQANSSFICSPSASMSQAPCCRICLFDEITYSNPLICPCKCAGTMKYIHLNCLQEWLKNRLQTRQTGHSISYFWKTLNCELCKEMLPSSVTVKDRYIELMSIPRPETPFLLLEDISREDRASRGLHMISMLPNSEIKMVRLTQGRGQESDIRIDDISVSRNHAIIKMKDRSFCIEDCKSKFGTLVLAKRPLLIVPGTNLTVQVNRTLITVTMKKPRQGFKSFFGFFCCSRSATKVVDSAFIYKTEESEVVSSPYAFDNVEERVEEGTIEAIALSQPLAIQSLEHISLQDEQPNEDVSQIQELQIPARSPVRRIAYSRSMDEPMHVDFDDYVVEVLHRSHGNDEVLQEVDL